MRKFLKKNGKAMIIGWCLLFIVTGCNTYSSGKSEIRAVALNANRIDNLTALKGDQASKTKKPVICIEAGHQSKANMKLEPIAPGSKTMKAKVMGGTRGIKTKKPEYQLNLEVALKLEKALTGDYKVVMVRRDNKVDISNSERAVFCNDAKADVMVRIHADGSDNPNVTGMTFFYPSFDNQYTKPIAKRSMEIAKTVSKQVIDETEAKLNGVRSRGDLTGFNWVKVPTILIEMGFMTNKKEDALMSKPDYQDKIVAGIKKGLDVYYNRNDNETKKTKNPSQGS
ncbi:N-acetylmuramoyl-L-alanine amidase family protein [Cohnella silvisoli]|uniref:N-acetylmuramoyl-L-alanine amidase n=1 Tax=Cohnella silvisoli TaxID=2873699 RepID=A0ABV1KZP1_9BACL|nr:N-acetylmuramoyl-L-alanine amidase [Cohnella silvisoli]